MPISANGTWAQGGIEPITSHERPDRACGGSEFVVPLLWSLPSRLDCLLIADIGKDISGLVSLDGCLDHKHGFYTVFAVSPHVHDTGGPNAFLCSAQTQRDLGCNGDHVRC